MRKMKKYIHATKEQREHLMRIFKCTERTIRNALTLDESRGNTELARKIRFTAIQSGCHTYVVTKEFECFHDADGIMYQLFPNGAQIELNKLTGNGAIIYKGSAVAEYTDVHVSQISTIQERAAAI